MLRAASISKMRFIYDVYGMTQINSLNDIVSQAIGQDPFRLGYNIEQFTQCFIYKPLGMSDSTWSNDRANKIYGYTWYSTLQDMARVGLLVLHGGMYNGKRVLAESWVCRMTHPSFSLFQYHKACICHQLCQPSYVNPRAYTACCVGAWIDIDSCCKSRFLSLMNGVMKPR